MKNLFILVVIALAVNITSHAQVESTAFNKGTWELNFTGSLGSVESNEEVSSSYYYINGSQSETRKYMQFGVIPAYYFIDGFSIEPEINILTIESVKPAFLLLGNLSYTFKLESSHFHPFIRVGYGVTNSIQIPVSGNLTRYSDEMDIGILNFGAGMKTMLTESVLLRTEINYRKFSYSKDSDYYNYKLNLSSIALIFGFSVLL